MNDADSGRPTKRPKGQELDPDPIKNGLCQALDAITPSGGFAAAAQLPQTIALPIWVAASPS